MTIGRPEDELGASRRPKPGRVIAVLVKLTVGGVLLYLLINRVDIAALGQALLHANVGAVVLALAGLTFTVSLNAVRWRIIVRQLGGHVSTQTALAGTFEGMFFNLFLPTNVGGDAARAYRAYDVGVPLGTAVASGLADRAVGLASVMGLLLVGSLVAPEFSNIPAFWLITAFSAAGLVAAVALAAGGKVLSSRALWAPLRLIIKALDAFATVIFSRRLLTHVLPITVVANLTNCLVLWSCAQAVGLRLTYLDAVVVLEASSLAAILPISFGGWGVREGATAALLSAIGNPMTSSIAASILYAGILVALGCLGAGIWIANPYGRKMNSGLFGLRATRSGASEARTVEERAMGPSGATSSTAPPPDRPKSTDRVSKPALSTGS